MTVRGAALFLIVVSICHTAAALPSGVGTLTWSDEFNGSLLDLTRWQHRAPGPRHDAINTPLSIGVGGGNMTITTFTVPSLLPGILPATHFTGQISTQSLAGLVGFEQTYGYWESRINFNNLPGQWSSFWLQSPTIGNPIGNPGVAGVEMDVIEHRALDPGNNYIADRAQTALIWDGYGPAIKTNAQLSAPLPGLANNTWHTYGLKWSPAGYTFYYDDVAIRTLTPSPTSPVSNRSQFIILSSEVWTAFAGSIPGGAGYGSLLTSTTKTHFDYVRVYGLTGGSAIPEPAGLSLLATGAVALAMSRRRRSASRRARRPKDFHG